MGEQESHAPRLDTSSHGIQPMSAHAAYEQARGHTSRDQSPGPFGYAHQGPASYTPQSATSYSAPSPASFSTAPEASLHYTSAPGATWSAGMASPPAGAAGNAGAHQSAKPGLLDSLSQQFGDEIEMLKTAAVTSLVSLVRDTIRQNFPSMHQEMERMRTQRSASTSSSYATKSGYPDDTPRGNPAL
jgi:hypothetical protein